MYTVHVITCSATKEYKSSVVYRKGKRKALGGVGKQWISYSGAVTIIQGEACKASRVKEYYQLETKDSV